MPIHGNEQESLNVKLVHATKQNSPEEPVQFAFSVIDEQGIEQIVTGEVPYAFDLFRMFQEQGWLNQRRGIASVRPETRSRRVASA